MLLCYRYRSQFFCCFYLTLLVFKFKLLSNPAGPVEASSISGFSLPQVESGNGIINIHFITLMRIRDVYPGSEFFPFSKKIPDLGSRIRIRIKEFKYFNPEQIVSKLSEIWSGLFIPDPDPDFLPIPDPGIKKALDPYPQNCFFNSLLSLLQYPVPYIR